MTELSERLLVTNDSPEGDLWEEIFPFEILLLRRVMTNKIILNISIGFFTLCSLGFIVYALVLILGNSYFGDDFQDMPVSLLVLLNLEGFIMLLLPFINYYFSKAILTNKDVNKLIGFALKNDSSVKLRFSVVTHLNTLVLLGAVCAYGVREDIRHIAAVILTGIIYFGCLNVVVSLALCVIELHRIRIQCFRDEIDDKRCKLESRFWTQSVDCLSVNISESSDFASKDNGFNNIDTKLVPSKTLDTDEYSLRDMRDKYYMIFAICCRSSNDYGMYLLFLLMFGGLYAFATIYSIYLDFYPVGGLVGFVLVGVFMLLGIGAALTACNETGHLVYRDFSSYLLSLPNVSGVSTSNIKLPFDASIHEGSKINEDIVMLMSSMTFMKLQICYFGNLALRSSLSFAVLGSLLLGVIPVVIKKGS